MNQLNRDEEALLKKICDKYNVNPDHLRILLLTEKEYSQKSSSQSNACRGELMKNIELWAKHI
jgi:hypothetical protein